MKTIIAVTFFGILTYAFADHLEYGKGVCQTNNLDGFVNLDQKKFFSGTWYLTHATPSARVTKSTICRDFAPTQNGKEIKVTYGYYENGGDKNRYDVSCTSKEGTGEGKFNFECNSKNERGETTNYQLEGLILAADEKFGVIYRCAKMGGSLVEDNVFIVFRQKDPSEEEVKKITDHYGLTNLISRKDATCTN